MLEMKALTKFQTKCLWGDPTRMDCRLVTRRKKNFLLGNKHLKFLGPPTLVTPNIQAVSDSLCHLVSQCLIRDFIFTDKLKQLQTYSTVLFSVSHLIEGLFIKPLITYKEDTNTFFSLLSYNWHITDVFMTHELFIHLDSIQVVFLCSLPSLQHISPVLFIKLFVLMWQEH